VSPRIALVGAGAMGTIMATEVYPSLADSVTVAAVVDRHPERGAPLAERLGARHYRSIAEAMDAEQLDGVDIRLQHAAHADTAVDALDHGLHVLVEKPLAITLDGCRRIAAAAERAGRIVAVAENYPHLHAVRAAADAVGAGVIGEPLVIRSTRAYTLDGVWAKTTWRQGSDAMSGLLWDQGTHHTMMLRAVGGEIAAVSLRSSESRTTQGVEAHLLTLRFASGPLGESLYCWGTPGRVAEVEGTVLGTRGAIDISVAYHSADGAARLVVGADSSPATLPPRQSSARATRPLIGLILCVVAGALFIAFASLDPGLAFFMAFALSCLLGAAVFGLRLATTKTCPACGASMAKSATICGRCQTQAP